MNAPRAFEWDPVKAEANFRKHRVRFETAVAVFDDPACRTVDAPAPHDDEPRDMAIGVIGGVLYAVVHVERGDATRIISARFATPKERRLYANG